MNTSKVQVRISNEIKTQFEKAVKANGFDSSTVIRIMMIEYAKGNLDIGIKTVFDKEIEQGKKDYINNKFITAKNNKEIDQIIK